MKLLLLVALLACGPRGRAELPSNASPPGGTITLYRDRALVQQRVDIEVPPAGYATVRLQIAAGTGLDDLFVADRDRLAIQEVRMLPAAMPPLPRKREPLIDVEPAPEEDDPEDEEPPALPGTIELVIGAPTAGRHAVHVAYLTDRLSWEAAYTMTTTPARDHATVRGALAIRNALGIPLPGVGVRVVDAELGASIRHAAELLAASYIGAEPTTTPAAVPRDLGRIDLADGETRIELLAGSLPRPMRSVLVYDPIGTSLDRVTATPVRDYSLGVRPPAPSRVTESFEVSRDAPATRGLPGGPVRLLEREDDGTLSLIGEARLFDTSTRVADVDTIAIGTAEGVSGRRERREYTYDEIHKRLVEEFVITIDNERPTPVEVVVREHLYRGQNWTLAYRSAPIASKEGPQQISMRMTVPAKQQAKMLYVVVYTWQ